MQQKAAPASTGAAERGKGGRELSGKAMQDAVPSGTVSEKSKNSEEGRAHISIGLFIALLSCTRKTKIRPSGGKLCKNLNYCK
jgi:hypothetical protein